MNGEGIRATFTVTDSGKDTAIKGVDQQPSTRPRRSTPPTSRTSRRSSLDQTTEFVAAYKAGDDAKATRAVPGRARCTTSASSRSPSRSATSTRAIDLREADLEQGQKWTGWHRIEKDLWPPAKGYRPLDAAERKKLRRQPARQHQGPRQARPDLTFTVDQIGNGAKGLLDEVATSKITGEEDTWSHTDLWDFQANVDGARVGFEGLKPILDAKDPALVEADPTRVRRRCRRCSTSTRPATTASSSTTTVTEAQRKELSDAVNALAEPLSKLTASRHPVTESASRRTPDRAPSAARRLARSRRARARSRSAAAGVGGWAAAHESRRRRRTAVDHGRGRTPSTGDHQAGIATPAQDRLHFAAFDVTHRVDRAELVALLKELDRRRRGR